MAPQRMPVLTREDLDALSTWWRTGSHDGIPRKVIRRLKAARYAKLEGGRLVVSLAGALRAARECPMAADVYDRVEYDPHRPDLSCE